jgi:hypothetical protein
MNQKKLITILATITIIAILSVSLFFTPFSAATATTYDADNMTVNGVLASDSYVLFPYTKENLIFGFSKYGELINGVGKVGLKYDDLDVFANPNVLEKDWSQGWFIDIHYADLENNYKRAWAFAMYSDLSGSTGIGGDWEEGCTLGPLGTPYGGRKTNVWATTDPIKVLYDGPRRFVALTKTTLYDASTKTSDDVLVSITITFVFDKDKKVVTLFKDIKRLATGKFGRTFQIEFSNRGEWDIGTTSAPKSYAHFYDDQPTVYDYEYHDFYGVAYPLTGYDVCQMIDEDGTYVGFAAFWPQLYGKLVDGTTHITRSTILSSLSTVTKNETWGSLGSPANKIINISALGWPSADPFPIGLGATSDEPMVFKNKILLAGGGVDYTWTGDRTDTITFVVEPLDTDYITIVYKHEVNPEADDMISHAGIEPDTPYVIGEWCFDLRNEDYKRQFRAVTVYGLTDRHDGDDDDAAAETWSGGIDNIDSEVQYYLEETFYPYDLVSAVEKQTKRDVEFFKGDGITTDFELEYIPIGLVDWDAYCTFAERVLVGGVLAYPDRAEPTFGFYNYTLCDWPDPAGWGINFTKAPAKGTVIEVLYSTMDEDEKGRYEWMVVGKDAATIDSIGAAYMTEAFDSIKDIEVLLTGLDINETVHGPYAPFVMAGATTGTKADYRDTLGRTFLRDDWCTTYPVSSSNMLFSGGPLANLGAEYFNEFTNAFWARTEYVVNDTGQANKIFALSCWNRTSYGSGYAVISVYEDLNGTIGFLIWGTTGQDTYYATKWFWDYPLGITCPDGTTVVYSGIEYLQHENLGVTDIVLKIKYPTLDPTHPTVSIKERLGTISEKTPHEDP